jgi:hypothetical protein
MRTGLRFFWLFRGLARTCGPVLVLIGVGLLFSDITLLRILLPFRFIVAECSLIGSVVSVIAWYFGKRAGAGGVGQSILLLFGRRRADFWYPAVSCGVSGLPANLYQL